MLLKRQMLAIIAQVLFLVVYNLGTVFYQMRGVPAGQALGSFFGYFSGILAGGLGMSFFSRSETWMQSGMAGKRLRLFFFGALLFPGLFCLLSFSVTGFAGNVFFNAFQPFLWSLSLPVSLYLFFRHLPARQQALFFAIALSAGHICWALLVLLFSHTPDMAAGVMAAPSGEAGRILYFLNTARCVLSFLFAFLCWRLVELEAGQQDGISPGARWLIGTRLAEAEHKRNQRPRLLLLLLAPFLVCFFLNGFVGYIFFPRYLPRGAFPEYMHLALACIFPLLGLSIMRRGGTTLLWLISGCVLLYLVLALLSLGPVQGGFRSAVFLISASVQQVFLYLGALAFAGLIEGSRFPALTAAAVWIAASMSMLGRFSATVLIPALDLPVFAVACFLACLCVASLPLASKAFPLPEPPETPANRGIPIDPEKHASFSTAFGLTVRESELLEGLNLGLGDNALQQWMGITEHTVKYHLRGLLRKTGQPNRNRLLQFYLLWKPE